MRAALAMSHVSRPIVLRFNGARTSGERAKGRAREREREGAEEISSAKRIKKS